MIDSKKKKILVLGYFGYLNDQLDGQTIKTRNIYQLLKSKENTNNIKVSFFDTQSFKTSKSKFLSMILQICKHDTLVYIGAHNSLKYLFPIIYLFCKPLSIKIHFVVVGGWLADYLKTKPLHTRLLGKIGSVFPQTYDLSNRLREEYGFKNVYQLQNFRILPQILLSETHDKNIKKVVKLVFLARVNPMKGIDTLLYLMKTLQIRNYLSVSLDIYGPITNDYKEEFEAEVAKVPNIRYKGIIGQEEVFRTLPSYDLMLFPTKYFTEGFPGTILDAYNAGVPVIATKWKYANEFIKNGVSGIITEFGDDEDFVKNVISLLDDPRKCNDMRKGAKEEAMRYSPEAAWAILKERLSIE